jgi:CBS domain containing-hemolysin-like protein
MEDSHAEGVITKGEAQIIMRAFEFSDSAFAVVSMKDAWPLLLEAPTNDTLVSIARPLPEVREDATQDEVLEILRAHHTQLALVRATDGNAAAGIVTLEDVLEALHGDMRERDPRSRHRAERHESDALRDDPRHRARHRTTRPPNAS